MIESYAKKHYGSAHRHLFASAFDRFLKQSVPQVGGPEVRQLVVDKIIELFDTYTVPAEHIKPGQMLWVAVDKNTRADSKKVKYRPVVLTMINLAEINDLATGNITPDDQMTKL